VETDFQILFRVALLAFLVPFVAGFFPKFRIPTVVLEILAGVIFGPAVLGWLQIDDAITLLSSLGVAFLLFLAGLELDLTVLRGSPLRLGAAGFALSFGIGVVLAFSIGLVSAIDAPFLVAVAMCSTSVGVIVPVLRDTGTLRSEVGVFIVAGGAAAEFGSIVLLGLFFGVPIDSVGSAAIVAAIGAIGLLLFALTVTVVLWALRRMVRWEPGARVIARLEDTSSQLGTRAAISLVLGMAVLAAFFDFEPILGTFLAGIFVGALIRGHDREHITRGRLEAVGFGFLVPIFFIVSGMGLDVATLFTSEEIGQIAIFVVFLLIARGLPAVIYRAHLSAPGMAAAGLMQATNLSFIVVAVTVGAELELISPLTASAMVMAGLVSAIVFPALAQIILAREVRVGAADAAS
jgi:Kef-type K+ transport system membrane component KefB